MKKEIKLIAVAPKYKKHPLILMAPEYGNTYITGQEEIPGDEKTKGGLTADQMLGKAPLTKEQQERFPYILKPDVYYHFHNNMTFNMENPEHEAKYNFLLRACNDIARSKVEFVRGKHTHYFYDKVVEAKSDVSKMDLKYEAWAKVKGASLETVKDVASYLSFVDVEFYVKVDSVSIDEIYAALYKACEKTPQRVIDCFTKDIREEILVVKMMNKEVIKKTKDGFEDNGTYLGKTINDVIAFSRKKENVGRVSRWESFSNNTEKKIVSNSESADKYMTALETALANKNVKVCLANVSVLEAEQLSEGQKERFLKLKEDLVALQEEQIAENERLLAEAKKKATEEYSAMGLDELYKLCGNKKIKGEFWKEKTKEEVIELLVSKVKYDS